MNGVGECPNLPIYILKEFFDMVVSEPGLLIQVPVPCVPPPYYLFGLGREADRFLYLQLQEVKMVCRAPNLREQPSSIITDFE